MPVERNGIQVPVTTIDRQVEALGLGPPYFIKLDTHGYEVPILRGATKTLAQSSVVVVECYNFPMQPPERLLFPEMCQFLAGYGFRCMDMYDLLYRPYDAALWQMDILFMKADRSEFSYLGYFRPGQEREM